MSERNITRLIPRQILFGNPDKTSTQLSFDGTKIGYLAPVDGVLNVWVGPAVDPAAANPVTKDTGRGIRFYGWAYTNDHVLYIQDKDGDENWRLYSVDVNAVGRHPCREAHVIIVVGDEADKPLILLDETPFAGVDVDEVKVVKLRDPVVERNEDLSWEIRAHLLDPGLHTLHGGEILGFGGVHIHAV